MSLYTPLINFLAQVSIQVQRIEADAEKALYERNDEAAYRTLMLQKALLLASMAEVAAPLLAPLETSAPAVCEQVRAFSASAQRAIELDSVFYMSALLYPDNHQPGEPNNLELFLIGLR